jgi:hypothetical protein
VDKIRADYMRTSEFEKRKSPERIGIRLIGRMIRERIQHIRREVQD